MKWETDSSWHKHTSLSSFSIHVNVVFVMLLFSFLFSDDVREKGFTVILDMRGTTWQVVKPILKAMQVTI